MDAAAGKALQTRSWRVRAKLRDRLAHGDMLAALEYDARAAEGSYVQLSAYNLFWIFVICSFGGLLLETAVSYPVDGMWKDRAGLVWGPFSPLYGLGAVCMTLFLNNMKDCSPWRLFARAALVGAMLEYAAGWIMENLYGMVAWSYIDQPLNLSGYTCLGISVVWGIAGCLWMKFLLVPVVHIAQRIPAGHIRTSLTLLLAVFLVADVAMTFASVTFWFDRMAGVPVQTPVQEFFAQRYGDAFMSNKFQTVSMYTQLALR